MRVVTDKLRQQVLEGQLGELLIRRLAGGVCVDPQCPCHVDPAATVTTAVTPCCSCCARRPPGAMGRR